MVILITGITSGFGKAMAERLSADGHKVYGTHRRDTDMLPGVTYIKADVRDLQSVKAAVEQVISAEGAIDVFINNAGMGIGGPLEFTSIEDAQLQMDTNFMGMVRSLNCVVPAMRERGRGRLICFSSIAGLMGLPFQGMYSASKFAIEGYCESLRLELRGSGVDVVVIEPGDFATAFTASRKKVCSEAAAAAYPSYTAAMQSAEHDEQSGLTPDYLADRISRIVRMKHPANRYVVATFVQKISILIKKIVPAKAYDWMLSKYYKM